jgi:hypothetical protein
MVAMKVRSSVLVACMLVVPALALFSHLTPPAAREFLRGSVCDPLCQMISAIDAMLPFESNATLSGRPVESSPTGPTVIAGSAEPIAPPERERPNADQHAPVVIPPEPNPRAQAAAVSNSLSPLDEHDRPRSQGEWAMLATLREQLAKLGATGIDCRPQPGAVAGYASSCRMSIDADGQLLRMFHGQGPDALSAMRSLITQIEGWKVQQAGTPRQRF